MIPLIVSAVVFQVTWVSAAFLYTELATLGVVSLYLLLRFSPESKFTMMMLSAVAVSLGIIMDAVLYACQIYSFPTTEVMPLVNIPLWLLLMWLAFSSSLFSTLHWALSKPIMFVLICAVFGPLSYVVGKQIGIINFHTAHLWIMVLAWGIWASVFLLMCQAVKKINKGLTPIHLQP